MIFGSIYSHFSPNLRLCGILTNSTLDPIGKIPELKFSAASVDQN